MHIRNENVQEVLQHSFAEIVSRWALPLMMLDRDYNFVFANQAYLNSVEREWEDIAGVHVFEAFPDTAENVEVVYNKFLRTFNGETTRLSAQPFTLVTANGTEEYRYWQAVQEPCYNEAGDIIHIVQYAEDVTQRIIAENERELITHEMSHRVKNILAVVQSIARLSSKGQTSVEKFTAQFLDRITAIGRSHSRLVESKFNQTDIKTIFMQELNAMSGAREDKFSLQGDDIILSAVLSRDLSMVVHELATNAAKYGCFSGKDGHLNVKWEKHESTVIITWRESGVGPLPPIDESGFGSKLLSMIKSIKTVRNLSADGLHIDISFNLPNASSTDEV